MDENKYKHLSASELAGLVKYHNEQYWKNGEPEISDDEYDLIVRTLKSVDPGNAILEKVEAPAVSGSGKVIHKDPMLSLDKAYSLEELLSWLRKTARNKEEKLLVQPKYDGISAIWSGGILATRGDGHEGEDITDKVPLVEIEHPLGVMPLGNFKGQARGEIVIREDDFKNLYGNIRGRSGSAYKNPRNAVAGIMGLKDIAPMLAQKAKLTLVDYSLYSITTTFQTIESEWQDLLEKLEKLPYPMDGIVVKIADKAYSDSLGNTAHHPRGQMAFKFSGIRQTSKLRNVVWSFGKNCLTPVAEIDPVEIGGVTIKRATLHNLQNVLEKDLKIGDEVIVERAGDVIPYIVSSSPGEERRDCIPEKCPECGSTLVRDLPELRCVNEDCFGTRLQRLLSAVKNIGIERLGEPNVRKMMTTLNVRSLSDVFRLTKEEILSLDNFKEKSAENLYDEIQSAKVVPSWQILASLNIRGIGPNIAKVILAAHPLDELRGLTIEQLSTIDGIGPERASALRKELDEGSGALDELLSCVKVTDEGVSDGGKPKVCFTGKMPEKRSFYEAQAKAIGYEPADSVTSALALLVAADADGNSSKLVKARKEGIKVVTLDEWEEMVSSFETPSTENTVPEKTEKPSAETEGKDGKDATLVQGMLL